MIESGVLSLRGEPLIETAELGLLGPHNADNAAAAAAAAAAMGIERGRDRDRPASLSRRPAPARAGRRAGGVLYVNDSKATNVAAAAAALRSFDTGVHAILGGSRKGGGFAELAGAVAERCAACYLIGEAAEALERDLEPAWETGVARRRCAGLAAAVDAAAEAARPGRGRPARARLRELRRLP